MLIFLSACSQILTSPKASYVITDELSNQDTTRQLLKQINFTINHRLEYQLDQQQYCLPVYWAAPIEALKVANIKSR